MSVRLCWPRRLHHPHPQQNQLRHCMERSHLREAYSSSVNHTILPLRRTRSFTAMFKTARYLSLSWARSIQSKLAHL